MSAFIAHTGGISLLTLHGTPSPTIQPLPLPSRFHLPSRQRNGPYPQLTVSPSSSHAFLSTHHHNTIWEYDQLGRRISEMTVRERPVTDLDFFTLVQALGKVDGREAVAVAWEGKCIIMEKNKEGIWHNVKTIETSGDIRFVARSKDGTVLALALSTNMSNEITLHHLINGIQQKVVFAHRTEWEREPTEIRRLCFSPSNPTDLYIASTCGLHIIDMTSVFPTSSAQPPMVTRLNPFTAGENMPDDGDDRVLGMTIAPVNPSGGGIGDFLFVSACGASALYSTGTMPKGIRARTIDPLADMVEFIDSSTLLLYESEEVKYPFSMLDLTKEDAREVYIPFKEHILGMYCINHQPLKAPRVSTTPLMQSNTIPRRILGESHQSKNGQTPPNATPSTSLGKGKHKEVVQTTEVLPRSKLEIGVHKRTVVPSNTTINLRGEGGRTVSDDQSKRRPKEKGENGRKKASHMEPPSTSAPMPPLKAPRQSESNDHSRNITRIVSEPIPTETSIASSSTSRSISVQVPPRHVQPRVSVVGERPASRAGPGPSGLSPIIDEAIVEEIEGVMNVEELGEGSGEDLDLGWAIRETQVQRSRAKRGDEESEGELGYLRKEMVRMQMDMLRMNRDLKGQIKEAVSPLLKELEEQRGLIGMQQREIERLRCRL